MPETLNLSDPYVYRAVLTVIILVLAYVLKRVAQHFVHRYITDPARQYRTAKFAGRLAAILSVITVVILWSPQRADLLTLLTVIGAGLAIAMREALLSVLGWFHLLMRGLYRQGDRIEIRGVQGDVVDIRLMHTTLMEIGGWVGSDQSTGRLVHIPNSWLFQEALYNYNQGFSFIWNEISFTVTFRSEWQEAQNIILRHAGETSDIVERQVKRQIRQMSHEFLIHYSILTPFVYVQVVDNGVRLTLRYLCEVRKRRGTEHALTLKILNDFREHGRIELAHPTRGIVHMTSPQFSHVDTRGDGEEQREPGA